MFYFEPQKSKQRVYTFAHTTGIKKSVCTGTYIASNIEEVLCFKGREDIDLFMRLVLPLVPYSILYFLEASEVNIQ